MELSEEEINKKFLNPLFSMENEKGIKELRKIIPPTQLALFSLVNFIGTSINGGAGYFFELYKDRLDREIANAFVILGKQEKALLFKRLSLLYKESTPASIAEADNMHNLFDLTELYQLIIDYIRRHPADFNTL